MGFYPVFIQLSHRPCLIIGGGQVAERKVKRLLDAGAQVTVIAPELTGELIRLTAEKKIVHINRHYQKGDLNGFFLVIASTDSWETNQEIYQEAESRKILLNVVDKPEHCNFFVPSVVKRGDLQIAVSTSGKVPYFAKKIRQFLEKLFPTTMENELKQLHELRKNIIVRAQEDEAKKQREFKEILEPRIKKILGEIADL